MTLCDAGPLYALVNKNDAHSQRCRSTLSQVSLPLITTLPCFTEAMYCAYSAGGWPMQKALWQLIQRGDLRLHLPGPQEVARMEALMEALMETYKDTPMDLADASLVVAAEFLNVTRIFTTDGDFYIYQIDGNKPFEVMP